MFKIVLCSVELSDMHFLWQRNVEAEIAFALLSMDMQRQAVVAQSYLPTDNADDSNKRYKILEKNEKEFWETVPLIPYENALQAADKFVELTQERKKWGYVRDTYMVEYFALCITVSTLHGGVSRNQILTCMNSRSLNGSNSCVCTTSGCARKLLLW